VKGYWKGVEGSEGRRADGKRKRRVGGLPPFTDLRYAPGHHDTVISRVHPVHPSPMKYASTR